ncbi:malate dehydrogenase (quinone) [Helicobacter monodelphidis]|uniref:malate dehydrogenase (quinone) n=1 Tax=Helicobacter sp. 15-1451 TaxID=2004995 RepID=UPI000DCC1E14|nr:malate dehydrogenase (quinone) [Helicobacter sp. 15-1451]RAX58402.1 malate dehydrogenase (quinone) [Helicobacter sp. 15-1451]
MNLEETEIALVGGGIMSITLATILKELQPSLQITLYEMLDDVALESSAVWNNAGTGHQALCELNYTPETADGGVDITKALKINRSFELSKEFFAYCIQKNILKEPSTFINPLPHISFVIENNVPFLQKRFQLLSKSPLFKSMQYTQDHEQIKQWAPILIEGRNPNQKVAATYMAEGSDIDFGEMVHQLKDSLSKRENFKIHLNHRVTHLNKEGNEWVLQIKDTLNHTQKKVKAKFVFLGAGGGSFPLLQKSGIPEGIGYGGFPVGGLWLVCKNQEVIAKHHAKVYGKASLGAPPMSLPHLDTRIIHGKRELLFGPYAGFNTKFLKHGSWLDMPLSLKSSNWIPMLQAGIDNVPLTIYLIKQVLMSQDGRMKKLDVYMPSAQKSDWEGKFAGQRVQVIKRNAQGRGSLQFGTEVITSSDGSLAALLGASPGASTTVEIMLEVIERCFSKEYTQNWKEKLQEMIPSYEHTLEEDIAHFNEYRSKTAEVLKIPFVAI